MLLFGVQNSKHYDVIAFHPVKKFVRKSLCDQATETVVINWTLFGAFCKKTYSSLNFVQKIITQTRAP